MDKRIIITIPAFNEERTIAKVIKEIRDVMKDTKYNYQLVVVNDGSKDKTAEIAKREGAIVYSHKRNKGLAETFKTEMQKCLDLNADVIVHTDADGQYNPIYIPRLLEQIDNGYDLVLGSRFMGKIESMPLVKRVGNILFSKVLSSLIGVKITDSTTGFRAFTSDVAKEINFINNFTYTQEQIIKSAKQKFKIKEIPIEARRTRESRLFKNPFEYAIKAWINIFRIYRDYNPLKFFGVIGLILISLSFFIGLWLVYLFFIQGYVGHLPLTIFTMILFVSGLQIILFGFMADMNKK